MSALSKSGQLVIGGPPRAELLPPEVAQGVKARALRRTLVALVILVVGVTVAGVLGATGISVGSAALLSVEEQKGGELIAQQAKYAEVRQLTAMIGKAEEGLELGSSTELRWKAYLGEIQASLPAGTIITEIKTSIATPLAPFTLPTVPLQGDRVAELAFTGTSVSLPEVEVWLDGLRTLTGFVDATPGTVELKDGGYYEVKVVMHVNSEIFTNPYSRSAPDADTTEED